MTHEELLAKIDAKTKGDWNIITDDLELPDMELINALRAVVELHKPYTPEFGGGFDYCWACDGAYPCPTIQAIEKELK